MSRNREEEPWAWGGEIGPVLGEARERLGLSLKEAERSTKIRARYLEGLEKEDLSELPGRSYVQAFLRSYAGFLGLDVDDLVQRFRERSGWRGQQSAASEPTDASRDARRGSRGTLLMLSLAVLALIFVISTLYVLGGTPRTVSNLFSSGGISTENGPGGGQQDEAPPAPQPGTASENNDPAGAETTAARETTDSTKEGPERPAAQSLEATVSVSGAESWISVESEDGVEYTGIAQPGFSRSFDVGESFMITTGNAGAVELEVNGQEYGRLGGSGEVTARSFTLKDGG